MKILALAAIAALGLTSCAFAADLATPAGPVAAAAAPGTDWTGAYLGLNAGYGPGTINDPEDPSAYNFAGPFVGGQVGYNFALMNGVVFGIQADLDWADENGTLNATVAQDTFHMDWNGSATARLGLATGSFMPYLLGGVAVDHDSESFNFEGGLETGTGSAVHVGWTAGIGAEAMLTDNLSGFIEGRYTDYGSANYTGTETGLSSGSDDFSASVTDWSVRGGFNWHMN